MDKKQIDISTRERVFAAYWGQKIARYFMGFGLISTNEVLTNPSRKIEDYALEVTPLSAITDDDAIEVAKIFGYRVNKRRGEIIWDREDVLVIGRILVQHFYTTDVVESPSVISEAIDFLRSRGYALPFGEYSVEDLVKDGVFKIKEVEK